MSVSRRTFVRVSAGAVAALATPVPFLPDGSVETSLRYAISEQLTVDSWLTHLSVAYVTGAKTGKTDMALAVFPILVEEQGE